MVVTHIRLLEAIKRGNTTRKAISEATGMQKGFAAAFGAVTKSGKDGPGKGTLVGDGLCKAEKIDGEWQYSLTAKGKAALSKESKEAISASQTVREVNRTAKPKASKGKGAKGSSKAKAGSKASKASK